MRAPAPSAVPRLLMALALLPALACSAAPVARAQSPPDKPPPRPSGGPAAAHAHPPAWPGAPATPQQVVVPAVPPAPPVLPPPITVPTRPPPPPTPTPVAEDAPGTASKTADGLRITFGAERSDLNPDSDAAIADLARAAPAPGATFTVTGFASGGDDPSTPRRLSLSRALAVRSALMQAGVTSVRIYVKALGASAPAVADGPPDRVDIAVAAAPGAASSEPAQPASGQSATPAPVPTQKAAP